MGVERNEDPKEMILIKDIIKSDTKYMQSALDLIKLEIEMGKGKNDAGEYTDEFKQRIADFYETLHIGTKRADLQKKLASFLGKSKYKEDAKTEYLKEIEENKQLYDQIEEEVSKVIGEERAKEIEAEGVEKDKKDIRFKGVLDTTKDFTERGEEVQLTANLQLMIFTHKTIRQEIEGIDLDSINTDNAANYFRALTKILNASVDWLKFLKEARGKHAFDMMKNKYIKMLDESINEATETKILAIRKRQAILNKGPEFETIGKRVYNELKGESEPEVPGVEPADD